MQPIIVRTAAGEGNENYSIVAGNRRFNACKALGWMEIPSRIVEADDKEAFQLSLTENIQRKSLNPVEEAYTKLTILITVGEELPSLHLELERALVMSTEE